MNPLVGAMVGAAFGAGVVMLAASIRGVRLLPVSTKRRTPFDTAVLKRIIGGIAAGLVLALLTGWPVVGLVTAVLAAAWPLVAGGKAAGAGEVARAEALTHWVEALRDSVASDMTLDQALPVSKTSAPVLLQRPLDQLIRDLRNRIPMDEALLAFGDRLDDASADMVVAALVLNSNLRGGGLVEMLTELATHARAELEVRSTTENARKPMRRGVWMIMGVVLSTIAGMATAGSEFMAPYGTLLGQLVLGVVLAIFAASFAWGRRLSDYEKSPRFLITHAEFVSSDRRSR